MAMAVMSGGNFPRWRNESAANIYLLVQIYNSLKFRKGYAFRIGRMQQAVVVYRSPVLVVKAALVSVKNRAADIPAAPNIMHITII